MTLNSTSNSKVNVKQKSCTSKFYTDTCEGDTYNQ